MRRTASVLLAGALALSFAACGDDDDDGGSDTTETTTADDGNDSTTTDVGDSGDESGSEAVQGYCDAVEAFVEAVQDAGGDSQELAALTEEGQEVAAQASDLATSNLSDDDRAAAEACSQEASDAFENLAPQG